MTCAPQTRRRPLDIYTSIRGDVFPQTSTQRCWVHKAGNVLSALPKSAQPGARRTLAQIRDAEDRSHAEQAIQAFAGDYGVKWPKAEHWLHLKTTNPIESPFATVRLRTRVTKGPGSAEAGLAMAFKLLASAQDRWRAVNGPHLVALVRGRHVREGGADRATE
jgi:putative transposase